MKKLFGKFFSKKIQRNIKDLNSNEEFNQTLAKYLSKIETQSKQYDYKEAMGYFYSKDVLITKMYQEPKEEDKSLTKKQKEKIDQKLSTEEQIKSNLFNKFSMKIFDNTENNHLINLANKSFVGDTDIPKDFERSMVILQLAKNKGKDASEIKDINFYIHYFTQIANTKPGSLTYTSLKDKEHMDDKKLRYIHFRDLYKLLTYDFMSANENDKAFTPHEKEKMYGIVFDGLTDACADGFYEAYYFLGMMHLNGYYTKKSIKKAYYNLCIAASYGHALSYYELYKILKEDLISLQLTEDGKKRMMLDYLMMSAEEGYTQGMYELGNAYIKGEICKRDLLKAIVWHRQAARNGFILSYEPCGDVFLTGGDGIVPNKILSLTMYFIAFYNGISYLETKIKQLITELKTDGEILPEFIVENEQKLSKH